MQLHYRSKWAKDMACKEQDCEIVRQDKITRIIFILQGFYFIAAHRILFLAREVLFS